MKSLWYEELPAGATWGFLWNGLTICWKCSAIRRLDQICPLCKEPVPDFKVQVIHLDDGREIRVPPAFNGAEGRYEDWVYLQLMEREWKRPVTEGDNFPGLPPNKRPSARAAIAILFWSYFETRIERLLRAGMTSVPGALVEDTLARYMSVNTRLKDLYKVIFGATYSADLIELGYSNVWHHLSDLRGCRNDFAHGNPGAITDDLVSRVVAMLKVEHESWIAVYNKRIAKPPPSNIATATPLP